MDAPPFKFLNTPLILTHSLRLICCDHVRRLLVDYVLCFVRSCEM